ncbi:MAG: hypothetical protein ACRDP6_15895 [Actinoallomurus sp.]
MKKKLFSIAAATAVAGLCLGVTGSASAEGPPVCLTTESAPFYAGMDNGGGTSYLFTLSAGRGFSTSGAFFYDGYGRYWLAGHGAEHPDREGWVLAAHTTC